MCIRLYQPTGNTAFKDSDKGQALKDGNIRRILHDEAAAICVKNTVQDCDACWNKREPKDLPAFGKSAFIQHDTERCQSTKNLPANHKIVSGSIAVSFVRKYCCSLREGEYELMQIVCQHHAHQYGGKQRQRERPARSAGLLRFPNRRRNENGKKRQKEHGNVVKIPQHTVGIGIGNKIVFYRPDQHPQNE